MAAKEDEATLLPAGATRSDGSPLKPGSLEADISLEHKIKQAGSRPPPLVPELATAFVVATMLASFCIGLIFGWGPFAAILQEEGVYEQYCAGTHAEPQTLI